jgi:hypothetical protein
LIGISFETGEEKEEQSEMSGKWAVFKIIFGIY